MQMTGRQATDMTVFAAAALGVRGGDHASEILRGDLENNMIQFGARTLADLWEGGGPP